MNSCFLKLEKCFQASLNGVCENYRVWEWCVILTSAAFSWKADLFFRWKTLIWQHCSSTLTAELLTKMKSVLPFYFSVSVSLPPSLSHSYLSTLYSVLAPFIPLFLLSFSLSSLTLLSLLLQSLWNCKAAGWELFWQRNLAPIRITSEHSCIPFPI